LIKITGKINGEQRGYVKYIGPSVRINIEWGRKERLIVKSKQIM